MILRLDQIKHSLHIIILRGFALFAQQPGDFNGIVLLVIRVKCVRCEHIFPLFTSVSSQDFSEEGRQRGGGGENSLEKEERERDSQTQKVKS